jgi:hypothetical protein
LLQLAKANANKTAVLLAEAHCKAHHYEGCKEVSPAAWHCCLALGPALACFALRCLLCCAFSAVVDDAR